MCADYMKKLILLKVIVLLLAGMPAVNGQSALHPQPSPTSITTLKYEKTYVKITYCRPHKRGRTVFGGMIPFGKVWRTGANEATEITVTHDIKMAGKRLPAGTYTLFTIPYSDRWTIIVNSVLGQWGAYEYDSRYNVLKFEVPVTTTNIHYEPFTIEFEQKERSTNLVMQWDLTRVAIPIQFM